MLIGAIEAGGTKFVLGLGDEHGRIHDRLSIPTETPEKTMGGLFRYFKGRPLDALGVGCFGPVDLDRSSESYGSILSTPKLAWRNYGMLKALREQFSLPVGFDTDVNGAVLGEHSWGNARGLGSALYLTVGTGIGAGIIVEGRLLHGLAHPEFGHIRVRRAPGDDFPGLCPYHGDCLEGLASGPALRKRWGRGADELPAGHDAWRIEADYLGQALAAAVLVLSPERIILGGGVMKQPQLFPLIRAAVIANLASYVVRPELAEGIGEYIVPPGLGDDAGLAGALALGLKALR